MRKIYYLLFITLVPSLSFAQELNKRHEGNVLYATGFLGGHLSSSTLQKYDTRWSQFPGHGWSTGLGVHLNLMNKWAVEVDFAYETSKYVYDHGDFRLSLPYRLPYADLKVTKFLQWKSESQKFWYFKLGGAAYFGNGKSTSAAEFNFNYNSTVTSDLVFAVMPEAGIHTKIGDNQALQIGINGKYSFGDMLTSSMQAHPEKNYINATAQGHYIGITLKYFYAFASFGGKTDTGESQKSFRNSL